MDCGLTAAYARSGELCLWSVLHTWRASKPSIDSHSQRREIFQWRKSYWNSTLAPHSSREEDFVMIYHLSWEEMGAGSEYPLLWSLPVSVFLSSDVPRAELWKLWGCPHAGCDLFGVPGYINDLVLSLHRDDSA